MSSLTHSPFNFVNTSNNSSAAERANHHIHQNSQMNNQNGQNNGVEFSNFNKSTSNQKDHSPNIPNDNNNSNNDRIDSNSSIEKSTTPFDSAGQPITTNSNNMNSKINKRLDRIPENLGPNGKTPSGKPRLFVCNVCTRAFARHEHLKRHERSHTKEKPFSCGVCQRKFSRRDLLLRHAQKLHAGCDDAIKRLRRRSSRAKSVSSPPLPNNGNNNLDSSIGVTDADGDLNIDDDSSVAPRLKRQRTNDSNLTRGSSNSQLLTPSTSTTNANLLFGNNHNPSHQRLIDEGRRSSFSAASAANYASVPQAQVYQDSVEFSTPQLLPVDNILGTSHLHNQSINSWLSEINTLPGLDFLNNFSLNDTHNNDKNNNQNNSQMDSATPSSLLSDSKISQNSSTSKPKRSSVSRRGQSRKSSTANIKREADIFGYSFYDEDFTSANQHDDFNDMKFSYPKLPSSYLKDHSVSSPDGTNTSNNYNDYELLSELEVPNHEEKILAAGYSFYESNDFAPSTMSPSNMLNFKSEDSGAMDIDNPNHDNKNLSDQFLHDHNNTNDHYKNHFDFSNELLFTNTMKDNIEKVLSKYPFVNIPPPNLPDMNDLNLFTENFKSKFLSHYPFIHASILNEQVMHEYTRNEELPNDLTSHVCLPLLISTIGSLYSGNKKISADLYEISRRCIHVYLDLRKKTDDTEKATTHNSPLWLVQSLILSVLYGLFAEYDESDLSVILRQVNALCTLIKVSKFTTLKFDHENIEINEAYFKDYILYQSKIRTVFMIFNITSTLTCFYDLSPFIKYKEIKCDLPDLENYWNCLNLTQFKEVCVKNSSLNYSLNLEKILNDMLMNSQISYKLSEFGANVVMFSLLQYFYFNKKQSLSNNFAGISPYHSNSSNLVKNYKWENMLTDENLNINIESILLKNILVIRSLKIDLSKVKDSMWHRRWNELSQEFMKINAKNDDLIDACDYSIRTISLVFINDVDSSNFHKCLSLTLQCLFFNFLYIAKFLHQFEKKVLKNPASFSTTNMKPSDLKIIAKNFSIYIKIAKFLADLEQILVKNFGYNDVESKLATKEFDESRYSFGVPPRLLNEAEYSTNLNPSQVIQVARLRLSSNILKIGEFVFNFVFEKNMNFNIFKSLSDGLFHLRVFLEGEYQQELKNLMKPKTEQH